MNYLHDIIIRLLPILIVLGLSSCTNSDEPTPIPNEKYQLGLNVVLPYMQGSRATYEPGDAYENTVDMAGYDYRLMLFTADSRKLVCVFNPADVIYTMSSTPYYRVCTFRVDVDESITAYRNLKMVMVANWGKYPELQPGITTIDDLAGYNPDTEAVAKEGPTTFSAARQLMAKEGTYIPLYGVKDFGNINWLKGSQTWLGDLWLLRSVAKIEVHSANGNPPIESVELTRYNSKGVCVPKTLYAEEQYVAGVDRYKPMNYVTLPGDANDIQPKNYSITPPQNEGDPFVIYVPEYRILDDFSNPKNPRTDMPVLNVKFKGVDRVSKLEFKYYSDEAAADNEAAKGDYFDIRRNFIYRYTLALADNGIVWDVDVLPYTSAELKPDFGLLLANVSLNKHVSKLYVNADKQPTGSSDKLIAYDENNLQLSADKVKWRLSKTIDNHVCSIRENADGTCTVTPLAGKIGRDIVEAVILDKNGFEVTAECIIETSERHLGLEKTFLGLVPADVVPKYSRSSFRVNIVAERDQDSKIRWEVLGVDDKPLDPALKNMLTVTAISGDGTTVENGAAVSDKNITINVQAGNQADGLGKAHVWVYYEGPDIDGSSNRRTYSTYCEVEVSNVSLTVYPMVLQMTVGQSTSITANTTPAFSDYIPSKSIKSENPNVVTVDNNGLVNAVGVGSTRIMVTSDDELLNGLPPQYVEVTVAPDNLVLMREDGVTEAIHIELLKGESVQLKAMSNGKDVSTTAKWDIIDAKFVSVVNGKVTALDKAGTSTVRATYTVGGVTYTEKCIVEVATERVLMIQEYPRGITANASVPMKAYVYPDSRPQEQRTLDVTWKSSNTSVIAFDDPVDKSLAVAKAGGTADITATATYNGKTLTATSPITVFNYGPEPEGGVTMKLKLYNASGAFVKEITTEFKEYANDVNVGGDNKFDRITIPPGQTWTAVVEFNTPVPTSSGNWSKYKRFSYHKERINITPSTDGKSCKITTINIGDEITTRYNEVYFKVEYNGKLYSRAFCVYTY